MSERTTIQARSHQHIKDIEKAKNYKAHMQGKGTKGLHTCKCLWPDNSLGPNNQVMLPHHSIKFFLLVLKKQGFYKDLMSLLVMATLMYSS